MSCLDLVKQLGRSRRLLAAAAITIVVAGSLGSVSPASAAGNWGPDTCLEGWVWREAVPGDHVCVTGATRAQAMYDNSQAAMRRNPAGGPWGPDTCHYGWVWREAVPGDHVCVTGATRSQAWADNAQAGARRNSINVSHSTYTIPPRCNNGICSITSTDSIPRFRLWVDHVNIGWNTVQLRKLDGSLQRSWNVFTPPAWWQPGGIISLDTGVFDCAGAVDSYFQVYDSVSTRWSSPHYVSSVCFVL